MCTLHEDLCTFMIVSRWILLRMRNFSDTSYRENQNTFDFQYFFPWKSCRLWDNVENLVDSGNILWGICFAYEETNTGIQIHTQNMIYLLTAIGLPPGSSGRLNCTQIENKQLYTWEKTIHKTIQKRTHKSEN
jgi:hypothetical protein